MPHDVTSAAVYTLHLLARRILQLTDQIDDLIQQITDTITLHCPTLLTRRGIGPDNAVALLIAAGDNPGRLRSEASFAALCGVNPPGVARRSLRTKPSFKMHMSRRASSSR